MSLGFFKIAAKEPRHLNPAWRRNPARNL